MGLPGTSRLVVRGGSWNNNQDNARVSTQDQNPHLQLDALKEAGCEKIFVEKASGAQRERPELKAARAYARGIPWSSGGLTASPAP